MTFKCPRCEGTHFQFNLNLETENSYSLWCPCGECLLIFDFDIRNALWDIWEKKREEIKQTQNT